MAEVVRIADIKRQVVATKVKLKAKSSEGVGINARLLELLESVEKTLLNNQNRIHRLKRTGKVLALLGLASWLVTAVVVADRFHGDLIGRAFDAPRQGSEAETAASEAREGTATGDSGLARPEPVTGPSGGDPTASRAAVAAPTPDVSGPIPYEPAGQGSETDDLVRRPDLFQGQHVVVTGPVVRLLQRYRLRAETGLETIPLVIEGLEPADLAEFEAAVEAVGPLGGVRAQISGQVERRTPSGFHLVASKVALIE